MIVIVVSTFQRAIFVFRRCKGTATLLRAKTIRRRDTTCKYLAEKQHKKKFVIVSNRQLPRTISASLLPALSVLSSISLMHAEAQRGDDQVSLIELQQSEVAVHHADVLFLVDTTRLLEPDLTLGQYAVSVTLTRHVDGLRLRYHFQDSCSHTDKKENEMNKNKV